MVQDYQKLSEEGHEEVDRTTKLDEKARILNKLLTERKEAAIKIHDCLLRINVSNKHWVAVPIHPLQANNTGYHC